MSRTARLGIFILGALAILGAGIFLIGREQGHFRHGYTLQATFDKVAGLQNGAEVRVGGIDEGTVKVIKLPTTPDGKVVVVMEMAKPTQNVIKKDSVGSIRTEGLVGAKFVEISFGSTDAPRVKDGDTIGSEPPVDISDLIRKTNDILDSTKSMTTSLDTAAGELKSIGSKVDQGKGTLGALVNDKKVYNELNATTAQAQAGATAFQDNMQALQHNFFLRGFFRKRGYNDSENVNAHAVDALPQEPPIKKFAYSTAQLFDKPDTAKLKSSKTLDEAGKFLAGNKFGQAVVVAYSGSKGDSDKDKTLTAAQSMVVRDYLVKNFSMNDTLLKTMGMGKNAPAGVESDGGVEILIYPAGAGSEVPYAKNNEHEVSH